MNYTRMASKRLSRLSLHVCTLALAAGLAACANTSNFKTGSVRTKGKPIAEMNANELILAERQYATAYGANPKDKAAGINYATILRMTGRDS